VSLPQVAAFQVILHHLVHNGSQEAVAVLEDGWVVRPGGFVGVVEELPERRVGGIAVRLRKLVSVHGVLKLCRNEVMSLEIL
jgi:hypothetical protein